MWPVNARLRDGHSCPTQRVVLDVVLYVVLYVVLAVTLDGQECPSYHPRCRRTRPRDWMIVRGHCPRAYSQLRTMS